MSGASLRIKMAVGLLALGLCSCAKNDGRKPTFPVVGKVQNGDKAIAYASVVLHPVQESGKNVVKPRGTTDANGIFKLSTYDGNDGAPAGDYKVTVEQWLTTKPEDGPSNRLPVKFSNPDKSGLSASIQAGKNELQPFELKK